MLDAEARLLEAAKRSDAPTVTSATVARSAEENLPGRNHRLSVDQAVAVEKIATSKRWIDVLVGPAGTGKSTTLAGLRAVWEAEHGPGSVIGLAPSAAAAEVLAGELRVDTDNTAKWLTEHRKLPDRLEEGRRIAALLAAHPRSANAQRLRERLQSLDAEIARWRLHSGQLLIIDEAGLAGTFALDELVRAAGDAGAKILLSGDWAQQGSVGAGGAFGLLARDENTSVAALGEVHRFNSEWERTASIELRHGVESALDTYESHDRITGGTREELLEAVYTLGSTTSTPARRVS